MLSATQQLLGIFLVLYKPVLYAGGFKYPSDDMKKGISVATLTTNLIVMLLGGALKVDERGGYFRQQDSPLSLSF